MSTLEQHNVTRGTSPGLRMLNSGVRPSKAARRTGVETVDMEE